MASIFVIPPLGFFCAFEIVPIWGSFSFALHELFRQEGCMGDRGIKEGKKTIVLAFFNGKREKVLKLRSMEE